MKEFAINCTCDRCGKKAFVGVDIITYSLTGGRMDNRVPEKWNEYGDFLFCDECSKAFKQFVLGKETKGGCLIID